MLSFFGGLFGVIDWSKLTEGLQSAFESGVTTVLPIAGVILAAFITFKAIRRFVKT
jgi:hypothetical protein